MRLFAGSNEIAPLAVAKMLKVGVALALIVVVTVAAGVARHWPFAGLLWQIVSLRGSVAEPVLADPVIAPLAPTLTDAVANAPVPAEPETRKMPSPVAVAESATTSGVRPVDPDSNSVVRPVTTGAGGVLVQMKLNATLVGAIAAVGVSAMTKLCDAFAGISTGVSSVPVTALVLGFVVW